MAPTLLENMPRDPVTGFLDSPVLDGFTIERKKAFIEYLMSPNSPGSLYKAIEACGIANGTFAHHLARDTAFAKKVDEVKRHRARVIIEGRLFEDAENPSKSNTLAQLAVLRAYVPERYARTELSPQGPQISINIDGNLLAQIANRQAAMSASIEAEVLQGNAESVDNQGVLANDPPRDI